MNYPYSDEFMYGADYGMDAVAGLAGVFLAIYFLFLFFTFAFSVLSYILTSLGTYTIAQRRGIRHPWLAWIPFGSLWILGSISDQFQYVAKGKIKNRRKVMLGLSIAAVAIYLLVIIGVIALSVMRIGRDYTSTGMTVFPSMLLGTLVIFVICIVLAVFQYISLYDLYSSCQPNNAALFLVLSILFSVTMPFFVFFSRKKDLGMPPRKKAPVPAQPEELPQPETVEAEEAAGEVEEETVEEEPTEEGFANPEEFEEA